MFESKQRSLGTDMVEESKTCLLRKVLPPQNEVFADAPRAGTTVSGLGKE